MKHPEKFKKPRRPDRRDFREVAERQMDRWFNSQRRGPVNVNFESAFRTLTTSNV